MSKRRKNRGEFEPPPHLNAEAHRRVMAWLSKATPEEIFQSSVRSGIYTQDGKLTKHYAPTSEDSSHR